MEQNDPKTEWLPSGDAGSGPDRSLRALLLLEIVATADGPLSLAQLSERLEAPKATLLRLLGALERLGYLLREVDEKTYLLGPRAGRLGLLLLRNEVVLQRHRLILRALVRQLGETCNLTALDGDQVIYIDRVETSEPLRLHVQPGTHVPLHCTASGKLFLAEMPGERRRALLERLELRPQTDRSITDVDLLESELGRVQARGVGLDSEEFVRGMVAVAVPIRNAEGHCVAALACHAPTARKSLNDLIEYIPQLQAAAAQLAASFALPAAGV
ncbi:IclR family transcriptional regulator [Pseudomonas lalucatii]|uniref:IclR family transcriptional regulator n=1 Tax=Pseudomonas lalucatii TaxID=1424203 RepID=A0ABS5Q0F9_9PSED|nr:IclR family transcriptional regulator [Pseudomonas lalucatii]MBS7661803.1 IclR family transcriptional regulator [Pseudomonas lalucatii]